MIAPRTVNSARMILGFVGAIIEKPLFLAQTQLRSAVILLYHRVSPDPDPFYPPIQPDAFRRHLELLRSNYTILHLNELVARLQSGRSLRGCCAITFDDGFGDFLTHAYPILLELNIPVTHFVTTQGLITGRPTWNYRLNRVIHSLRVSDDLAHSARGVDLPSMAELMQATRRFDNLSVEDRDAALERLEAAAAPLPPDPPMIRVQDLRKMQSEIVRWGSHTVTHPTLPGCTPKRVAFELAHSKVELERILEVPVQFLAYPNGHADAATMRIAMDCGYTASFTCDQRRVGTGTPLHAVPRFNVGEIPANMLGLEFAGITPNLRRLLRG